VLRRPRAAASSSPNRASVKGRGVALLPPFIAEEALRKGLLRSFLHEYKAPLLTLYAIYPPTRHLAVKVRLFIDFLVERFSAGPEAGIGRSSAMDA
jgi:DNA-binding transcriptional LysR family regulator